MGGSVATPPRPTSKSSHHQEENLAPSPAVVAVSPDLSSVLTSTPVVGEIQVSPVPTFNDDETPRKSSEVSKGRPTVPPKPDLNRESRATSEPSEVSTPIAGVLSGGEHISLPPLTQLQEQTSTDSPMPELLSLKDRLKLFEAEIEQQHKEPEPKKDRKFSFLSQDEVNKMKEEEAKRIASMTAMSMEAFESITSQISQDEKVLTQHIEALDKYDTSAPHQEEEQVPEKCEEPELESSSQTDGEKRAAWRKARLQSLEEDALQAQIVIEKMSELSTSETGFTDNASYQHHVDTQGNITDGHEIKQDMMEQDTDSEMTTSEDTTGLHSPISPFPDQQ